MFRFANPEYLYLLILVPLIVVLYFYALYKSRKKIKRLGDPELISQLMPDYSAFRASLKLWILFAAFCCSVLMLARPQFGTKEETVKKKGVELIIALDVSNSMRAEDVSPDRLERAKMLISKLVDKFDNDKVGLIVFAGDAFTQLPITSDFVSAKMFLNTISPEMVERQGTNLKAAIDLAARSFTPQKGIGKSIILITDGENHEEGALEAAAEAQKQGYTVNVLGIGSPEGAPIPDRKTGDYRKDREGNTVITRLNEEMCKEISAAGKGIYARIDNSNNAQNAIANEIDKMAKSETDSKIFKEYDEQYQAVAWIVLLLLVAEICVLERKNPLFKNIKLFSSQK